MEYIDFKGEKLPLIGYGTWCIGDNPDQREKEIESMLYAIERYGITLIDTAEMYGLGKSESVVGVMLRRTDRSKLYIVDKILPENAIAGKYEERVKNSLDILQCGYIDLYLLHWKSTVDLQLMVNEMENLVKKGYIRHWGVSNFDTFEMEELFRCHNGRNCYCNQILYNVGNRGVEFDLLPWCRENGVMVMAYSTLGDSSEYQKPIFSKKSLRDVAQRNNTSIYNIMLRFAVRNRDVIALFKTSSKQHMDDNLTDIWQGLSDDDMRILEKDFPAPAEKQPLNKI